VQGSRANYTERVLRNAGTIRWDHDRLSAATLDEELARILHVAALLEDDTAITVRQAQSLGIQRSDDLARFLPMWDEEEAEHGRALHALLSAQTYTAPAPAPASISRRRNAVAHLPTSVLGRLPPTAFLFCVLGAAAEYVATVTYTELIKRAYDPAVGQLLRDITRQEARHFAFFLAAAKVRGNELSNTGGRVARRVLTAMWEPIGVPSLGRAGWEELFGSWLEDEGFVDRIRMMDRVVDGIPHLAGMHLMERFLDETATRLQPGPPGQI
jgi:hypothetical protein